MHDGQLACFDVLLQLIKAGGVARLVLEAEGLADFVDTLQGQVELHHQL